MATPVIRPVRKQTPRTVLTIRISPRAKRELKRIADKKKWTASALGEEIITAFTEGCYLDLTGVRRVMGGEGR